MAELSSMPHLDENKNTSTLSNHVPESDDSLHTSTNNGVKNITSEYTYQSPTSVKGNFSEISSNITVLSPKNLNILTPDTEGNFVKLEIGHVQDCLNVSILGETENSFKTANESLLGETNNSFRSLNGSYLEESAKSPNNSIKSLLNNTVNKIESPIQCPTTNTSLPGTEGFKNAEISFNDASSPANKVVPNCAAFLEVTSPMGNNPSSPESRSNRSIKNHLDNSTAELSSENQTFAEIKSDTSAKSLLDTTSTLEFPFESQTFTEEKSDTSAKSLLDTTSTQEFPFESQTFTEEKSDTSAKSLLDTTSTQEFPFESQTFTEEKSDTSAKSLLDTTSTQEFPFESQTFTEEKSDTSAKSLLDTKSTQEFPFESQTFTEGKSDDSAKSLLDTTCTLELPSENQTFTEEKFNTSAKSILDTTSTNELFSENRVSTEDKPGVSPKSLLDTASTLELPSDNHTTFTEDKPNTSAKISVDTTASFGSPAGTQAYCTEDKSDTSMRSFSGTPTLESPAGICTFTIEKPDTPAKSILGQSALESPAGSQTSFTKDKPDTPVKGLLDTSTQELPAGSQTSFTKDKPDTPVKGLLGTSTQESPAGSHTSSIKEEPNTSAKGLLGTSTLGSPAFSQTSFTKENPDTPAKGLLGTPTLESPAGSQTSFDKDQPDTPAKDLLEISTQNSPACNQTSVTKEKTDTPNTSFVGTSAIEPPVGNQSLFTENPDTPIKSPLRDASTTVLSLGNCPAVIEDKLNTLVKSPLETTTSAELSFGNNVSSAENKPLETYLDTAPKEASPFHSSKSSESKQVGRNVEVDVSFNNASPLPNKSASIAVDNVLMNDAPLSNSRVKSPNDFNSSAFAQASVKSCLFSDNSVHFQPVETTPRSNIGFRDTSRLINFSMLEDKNTREEFPFKVPSIKLDSSNTPERNDTDFQKSSQLSNQSTGTAVNVLSETFDIGSQDKIAALDEDPFGMRKSDPFDLMGMDSIATPNEDFVFKVPENPPVAESEEFTDAVQFFKDPSSFQFLENIKTSQTEANVPRSSLYIKFDPLHSKFPSQSSDILQALKNEANMDPNKQLNLSARESLGNILISFDSPRLADFHDAQTPVMTAPVKVYTEEELQQHLKVNELTNQEMLLKKQREMEEELTRKEKEMTARAEENNAKIAQVEGLLKVQSKCLEEFVLVSAAVKEKNKELLKKMEAIEEENAKLKGDVKNLTDDLQSVETTFADFHKRYEQCKGMLKTYKENEELLRTKLKEQEQAYQVLKDKTQESSEKASSEISNVKKSSEAQIAVLKAQLRKAELKISSLESDIKQIKIENSQLGGICDDLMEKVGKS